MTIAQAKTDLVALARSQIGYTEGPNNYNKYADDPKVVQLYGWCPQNQPWCCTFVNWVFLNAFGYNIGSRLTFGGTAACSNSAQLFKNNGAFVHMPNVGDQAFFYSGGGINHTGIVVSVERSVIKNFVFNYSDKVSQVRHNIGHSDVAGFGRPCWPIVEGEAATPPAEEAPETPQQPQKRNVLRKGMTGEDVKELQEKLIKAGYDVGPEGSDGVYGQNTFRAVVAFQEDNGLEKDGVAGPQTMKALDEMTAGADQKPPEEKPEEPEEPEKESPSVPLPELHYGSKGEAVTLLQAALNLKGFSCGSADGIFGAKTEAAVNRLKEAEGLEADGVVDKETWARVLSFKFRG